MAAAGTDQPIEKATGWQIPGAITKHVILDPGIAYTTADVLLFAGTNPVGLVAMLTATGVAASLKTAAVIQPGFIERHPRIKQVMQDDRTPLRAGGLALFVVAGMAIATGAWLPAAASALFAFANIRLAESISKNRKEDAPKLGPDGKPRKLKPLEIATLFFKRPELYLSAGFACAGLMAGGAALFMLPIVAASFAIGMRNAIRGLPEHNGHPKLVTASAAGVFTAIGHQNGHGLIAAAHLLNTIVLAEMERRVTPGGAKQIFKNIGSAIASVVKAPFTGWGVEKAPDAEARKPANDAAVTAKPVTVAVSPAFQFNRQAPVIIAVSEDAVPAVQEAKAEKPAPAPEDRLRDVKAPTVRQEDIEKLDLQKAFGVKGRVATPANDDQKEAASEAKTATRAAQPRRPKKPDAPAA